MNPLTEQQAHSGTIASLSRRVIGYVVRLRLKSRPEGRLGRSEQAVRL